MSKHTPGPWKFSEYHGAILSDEDPRAAVKSEVAVFPVLKAWNRASPPKGTHKSYDLQRANAQLIAAAPELLEALQEMVSTCKFMAVAGQGTPDLEDAEKAIAKATKGAE